MIFTRFDRTEHPEILSKTCTVSELFVNSLLFHFMASVLVDVDFSQGCSSQVPVTGIFTTTTPVSTVPTPIGIDMCSNPSQDFEQGFGTYTQDPADQFDWTRTSGSTNSLSTGPSFDHTTNSSSG